MYRKARTLLFKHNVVVVARRVQLFATPGTVAHQAPLSDEFSRQEYWSGLPCPSVGDLPDPGIEPLSPALAGRFLTTGPTREPPRPRPEKLLMYSVLAETLLGHKS